MFVIRLMVCLACAAASGVAQQEWKPLFDGKSLTGWKAAEFRGGGAVRVENGAILLDAGNPLTGVNCTTPLPKLNYEVRFEASKIRGGDFFASLTFPFGDSHATWVLGGWGGDIVGISSIEEWDASENETRTYFQFEPGKWYSLRLQVREDRIQAWIDDQQVVNLNIGGRRISMRPGEIEKSIPFGFASYRTTGAVRKIEYRSLRSPSAAGDRRNQ